MLGFGSKKASTADDSEPVSVSNETPNADINNAAPTETQEKHAHRIPTTQAGVDEELAEDVDEMNVNPDDLPSGAKDFPYPAYEGNLHVNDENIPTFAGLYGTRLIIALTATCTCGFLLFGYDQGVMAAIISGYVFTHDFPANLAVTPGSLEYDMYPNRHDTDHARIMQAFYTAIYEVGCFAGAIFSLFFGNRLGRIRTIQLGAVIMCVGVILQVTAIPGHWVSSDPAGKCILPKPEQARGVCTQVGGHWAGGQFLIGRTITGIGNGMNTATIPTWQSEVSPSKHRGIHVCIEASMIATGTAISYWLDFALHFINSSFNWRFPIAFQVVFAIVMLSGTLYLPESPRWLMTRNRHAEARRVIASITSAPYDDPRTHAAYVVMETANSINQDQGMIRKRDMLKSGPGQNLRRALLGASSQIYQQITGCNAVIYFLPLIFTDYIELGETVALILGGVAMTLYACGAMTSFFIVEKAGRRKMFLVGTAAQLIGMIIAFACMIHDKDPGHTNRLKGTVFGLFWYMIAFGCTWLVLPWLYPAEINPLRTRTNANALSTISNWSFNFAVVMWTPPMIESIDWGTFLFFAAINATALPVIYFFYPETTGRSLEEIDLIFSIGYFEKKWYVAVANELPKMNNEEVTERTDELYRKYHYNPDEDDDEESARATSKNEA